MLEHFMSLPHWAHVTIAIVGYFSVSFLGFLYSEAYNRTTDSSYNNIDDGWVIAWVAIWPIVCITYPIRMILKKGFLQKWLYEAPVLYMANWILESKKKKIEKHKVPEKDFHVKNDWRD